jgi:leader peptidase (prepilin peptidase)/N-methyltransferase
VSDPAVVAFTLILGAMLAAIAVWDARTMRIPDFLSLPLVVLGLGAAWTVSRLPPLHHVIGAAAGYGVLALLAAAYRRVRGRDGLGLGDAKLLAAAGAWLGVLALPSVLLIASFTGIGHALARAMLCRRPGAGEPAPELPFGPHIAAAVFIVWLIGPFGAAPVWQ